MIKELLPTQCVFDCEWIPDVETGRRLYGATAAEERESVSDTLIRETLWRDAGATEENPRPFLKLALSQIVCIGYVWRQRSGFGIGALSILDQTEAAIIGRFLEGVAAKKAQLVGYNSRNADLPALIQRGIVTGANAQAFCRRPGKPWEGTDYFDKYSSAHIDLMELLGGFGKQGTPKLNDLCVAGDCPLPKTEIDGADIWDLWASGRDGQERAIRYCVDDAVRQTWLLLKVLSFMGHDVAAEFGVLGAARDHWQEGLRL